MSLMFQCLKPRRRLHVRDPALLRPAQRDGRLHPQAQPRLQASGQEGRQERLAGHEEGRGHDLPGRLPHFRSSVGISGELSVLASGRSGLHQVPDGDVPGRWNLGNPATDHFLRYVQGTRG